MVGLLESHMDSRFDVMRFAGLRVVLHQGWGMLFIVTKSEAGEVDWHRI